MLMTFSKVTIFTFAMAQRQESEGAGYRQLLTACSIMRVSMQIKHSVPVNIAKTLSLYQFKKIMKL